MAMRRLRVYTGPERDDAVGLVPAVERDSGVRVTLGSVLPLLADAVENNRTWLGDFADEKIAISSDLHEVLQAYRHFRRPGA